MTRTTLKNLEQIRARKHLWMIMIAVVPLLHEAGLPEIALCQGMPPRGNTLMRTDRLTKSPVSSVERLREEIINATDPRSGTISIRQLQRPTTTRPEIQTKQNAVVTQYTTPTSTRPDVRPNQNASVIQVTRPTSTRPPPSGASSGVRRPGINSPIQASNRTGGDTKVRQSAGQKSIR